MSEKKTSLEDLLKSLEGHVVDSVEIKGEPVGEGDFLHVRISATELDPEYPIHTFLNSKTLAFNIVDADVLKGILVGFNKKLEVILSNLETNKTSVSKLLQHIKGTITETLRIRKRAEEPQDSEAED